MEEVSISAMNTSFYLAVSNSDIMDWKEIAMQWILYVEKEWSRFHSDNELAKINAIKVGDEIQVSPFLYNVIETANDYAKKTDFLFSPYLYDEINNHGYVQSFPFTETNDIKVSTVPSSPTTDVFTFNPKKLTLTKLTNKRVDLGGIAKGFVVDLLANWLQETCGAKFGMVDGGGDLTVWSNGEKHWLIGIADPYDQNEEIAQLKVDNASIATSNIVYRSWMQAGEKKHHILHGQTGVPVQSNIVQATVVATNCVEAEVAAKLCFMMKAGERDAFFLKHFPAVRTFLVNKKGEIQVNESVRS